MIIYIEGNIGSGKTTFCRLLAEHYKKRDKQILLEPVDEWMTLKDEDGTNLLERFYGDQEKWSFAFQMNSFISRVKKIQDADKGKILFVERSVYTDKHCFAENCYESGKMNKIEYDITETVNHLIEIGEIHKHIVNSLDNTYMITKRCSRNIFNTIKTTVYKYRGFE